MKNLLRSLFPQWAINCFYHLPIVFLANLFYGFPAKKLTVIGVTGTDGKTTTVNMIYQILKAAGKKVSMVSTINAFIGGKSYDMGFHVTSPNPFMVQNFLRSATNVGDDYMVLEVTSHGLDQYRFWGVHFEVGVITNITHEHLDYHKTFENYFKTKLRLLNGVKYAAVNQNVIPANVLRSRGPQDRGAGIQLKRLWSELDSRLRGDDNTLVSFGINNGDFSQKEVQLNLQIPGTYNIENALAAFAVGFVLGIDKKIARKTLENFTPLPGRMEEVKNNRGIKIYIDFAHTPNGLERALKALRSHIGGGKLISLIGCEGYRDVDKRLMMGEIAQKLSNSVIVTAVDPRGQMTTINRQIGEGARKVGAKENINFFVIEDRAKAIDFAINNLAKKGDIVGIFGKGHEKSMNMDGRYEIPWSDEEAVKKVLYGSKT